MWADEYGIWGRGLARGGSTWGGPVVCHYNATNDAQRQQWLHVVYSIDDQGNKRMSFNGTSCDTDVDPAGVAGNLNLESDMFYGEFPFLRSC